MATRAAAGLRLWRMRRRLHQVDATLAGGGSSWDLTFVRNHRRLFVWRYASQADARAAAEAHRRALERAGWTSHW
jgi:hypothetical protein